MSHRAATFLPPPIPSSLSHTQPHTPRTHSITAPHPVRRLRPPPRRTVPRERPPPRALHPRRPSPPPTPSDLSFWLTAAAQITAALFAIPLCAVSGLPLLGRGYTFTPAHIGHAVLLALPFSALFWGLQRLPTGIQSATDDMFRELFATRSVAEVAFFCACVALGEELLFRGWLLAGLEQCHLHAVIALVLSSVVFGVLHAYTRVYMLLATVAGLLFGGLFLMSGESVLQPVVVHFLYDFCTILAMQRRWIALDDDA